MRALADFDAEDERVLSVRMGDILHRYDHDDEQQPPPDGWIYAAALGTAEKRLVPETYVKEVPCVRLGAWGGEPGEKDHHIQ